MDLLSGIITIIYYALTAYVVVIIIWNLIRTKEWRKEVLYIVVLLPFLLRLLRLK